MSTQNASVCNFSLFPNRYLDHYITLDVGGSCKWRIIGNGTINSITANNSLTATHYRWRRRLGFRLWWRRWRRRRYRRTRAPYYSTYHASYYTTYYSAFYTTFYSAYKIRAIIDGLAEAGRWWYLFRRLFDRKVGRQHLGRRRLDGPWRRRCRWRRRRWWWRWWC